MIYKELIVYKKAFKLAMEIFEISKGFPKEEAYALTDQIRRSSRSVCSQIAEAYRDKKYPGSFVHKLAVSDGENAETQVWLDFCRSCRYIDQLTYDQLLQPTLEIGRLLNDMIHHPEKYGVDTR